MPSDPAGCRRRAESQDARRLAWSITGSAPSESGISLEWITASNDDSCRADLD